MLKNSNFLAIHNSRVKLIPSDILLYNSFFNGGKGNPYIESNLNLFSLAENVDNMSLVFENEEEQEKTEEDLLEEEDDS